MFSKILISWTYDTHPARFASVNYFVHVSVSAYLRIAKNRYDLSLFDASNVLLAPVFDKTLTLPVAGIDPDFDPNVSPLLVVDESVVMVVEHKTA